MVYVLMQVEVQDYTVWRTAFDDAIMIRRNAGEQTYRVFRDLSNSNDVTILCDFDTLDHARKFLDSEALKNSQKNNGVIGHVKVKYVQEALSMRRTEAD